MSGGTWFRLDVGLLDDERFEAMDDATKGQWIVAYMLIKREGGSFKDDARLIKLMTKQGAADPAGAVAALRKAGWFVEHTEGGFTLRGYQAAQEWFRGPSDMPEAKAARNAKRPTTRAGRGASVKRKTVDHVERRGATPTNGTNQQRGRARPSASAREEKKTETPKSLNAIMGEIGAVLPWEKTKS